MPVLDIIIISWNTEALTRACLTSLYSELAGIDGEAQVWIVDNNSGDGSAAMVRREFPQVHLIENQENVGFARANNQVLSQATAPFQLLLNSDTVVHPGSLAQMLKFLQAHADISAVGPKLVYPDGIVQRSYTCLPSARGELKYCMAFHFFPFNRLFFALFGFGGRSWEADGQARPVEVLSAACLLIRKEVFDEVGLLAENYFLFSEENDLFCRMMRAGYRSYYFPEAVVTHVVGASRRQRGGFDSQINFLKSRMIYFQRYHPNSYGRVLRTYRFFLNWSLAMAKASATLKRLRESDFVLLYRKLLITLDEVTAGT